MKVLASCFEELVDFGAALSVSTVTKKQEKHLKQTKPRSQLTNQIKLPPRGGFSNFAEQLGKHLNNH